MPIKSITSTPFFANKNQAFWRLQLIGWVGAFLLRAISTIANSQPVDFLIVVLIASVTGFSISLILSAIYRQLINRKPIVTWAATSVVLALAVGIHAFIDSWVLDIARPASDTGFVRLFVGIYFIDLTLLGAWSALYYAINFFLQVEEQADRLERLEAQATSAQLAMLRYQLNPHFLFNTLNSISTLVLLKQTGPANAMLTRLASFLRHTLVTEPGGKVTMDQEVETLKLYLDIERMRFEDRLQTRFRLSPEASAAKIPSMLLQPLIENAVKYGVTPLEGGAQIGLTAQVVGTHLRVIVSDTGPGIRRRGSGRALPAALMRSRGPASTGVGLANIRDRLIQAYGEDHRFEIRSPEGRGFTVIIEIPYETAQSDAASVTAEGGPEAQAAPPAPTPSLQLPQRTRQAI